MEFGVCLFLLIIMLLISFLMEKSYYSPLNLFLSLWIIVSIFSKMQLYGMYNFSSKVYWIVLVGNIGYFLGYLFMRKVKKKNNYVKKERKYIFKEKTLKVLSYILFIFYLLIAVRVVLSMKNNGYSYSTMRTIYMHGTSDEQIKLIYGSYYFQLMELFIFKPLLFASISISSVRFLKKMNIDSQIILSFLSLILFVIINFGRIILIQTLLCVFIGYKIIGNKIDKEIKKKIKKKFKKIIFPVLIIFFVGFVFLSNQRQADTHNSLTVGEQVYSYLAIPMPIMDYWINYVDNNNIQTYGMFYIKGLANIVDVFTSKLGISLPFFNTANELNNMTEVFLPIFPNHVYNAFVSIFYYFYVDWRFFGVFLGSFIYGLLMGKLYDNALKYKDVYSLSILLLMYQGLLKCFVRWEFVQMSFWISIIWILFLVKKVNGGDVFEEKGN